MYAHRGRCAAERKAPGNLSFERFQCVFNRKQKCVLAQTFLRRASSSTRTGGRCAAERKAPGNLSFERFQCVLYHVVFVFSSGKLTKSGIGYPGREEMSSVKLLFYLGEITPAERLHFTVRIIRDASLFSEPDRYFFSERFLVFFREPKKL